MYILMFFYKICRIQKYDIEQPNYELDCSMYNGVYRNTPEEWNKQQKHYPKTFSSVYLIYKNPSSLL
mgnify:CR=1 FL=1